ncbi:hypothetical protein BaRGS_00023098 [Batillaria attramentaria]|uniref:Endonuclease/exonuclease/phosphatase domain-containing protein n=1 Tax=Batillaria attramentaria TaxID=370345 RepID=A0ABD0KET2_9CAEN
MLVRRQNFRPALLSLFLANIRLLKNKSDELLCLLETRRDFKDCCVIVSLKLGLTPLCPTPPYSPRVSPFTRLTGAIFFPTKLKVGGGGFLVNNQWCSDINILSKTCSPELDTLTIKCRPFYLPREFSSVLFTAVYVPPQVNTNMAVAQLSDMVTQHENSNPDSICVIAGDFNKALRKELPKYALSFLTI